jgi:hypothetical protein
MEIGSPHQETVKPTSDLLISALLVNLRSRCVGATWAASHVSLPNLTPKMAKYAGGNFGHLRHYGRGGILAIFDRMRGFTRGDEGILAIFGR